MLLEVCADLVNPVIQAELQKGWRGYESLFLTKVVPWTSASSPCPQQVKLEQHHCEKDGFMGWSLNRSKKLSSLYTRRKYQPPISDKGFNSPEQQMLVKHGNKGSNSAPNHAKKTPKTNPEQSPNVNEWIHVSSSVTEEPLCECSSWFLRRQLLFMQSIYTFSWLFVQRNYFIV